MSVSTTRRRGLALLIFLIAVAGVAATATGQEYWVDATSGNDVNPGTELSPFATITYAVAAAGSGTTIHVLPGMYDGIHGETFPIMLQPNQVIIGDPDEMGAGTTPTAIVGQGPYPALSDVGSIATVVCAAGSEISGFQFDAAVSEMLQVGVVVHGLTATVRNNSFPSTVYAAVFLNDAGSSLVEANLIESESYGIYVVNCPDMPWIAGNEFRSSYVDVFGAETNVVIIDNVFSGSFSLGVLVQHGKPWIEANTFQAGVGDTFGAVMAQRSTALPIVRANTFLGTLGVRIGDGNPDLGHYGASGGNDFQGVTGVSVMHTGSADVRAIGNLWPNTPPIIGTDIVITGSGSVLLIPVSISECTFGSLKASFAER